MKQAGILFFMFFVLLFSITMYGCGGDRVERLIEDLRWEKDLKTRERAANSLREMGTTAVEPLIVALKDKDSSVRQNAADILGEIKDPRAIEPLIVTLRDGDFYVKKSAVQSLRKIGKLAVEPLIRDLIRDLKDTNQIVREFAAETLGEIKDPAAVEDLFSVFIKDESNQVRYSAARALGKIGTPAVGPLIGALKNKDLMIREVAASTLGDIRDLRAVEPLIVALRDENSSVRYSAALALGEIKDPKAVKPLIRALKDNDYRADVRDAARRALGEMGIPAVGLLIGALRDVNWEIREGVAEALGKIKDKRAVKPLIISLKDKDLNVRSKAAWALGVIGDKEAIEPLIENLTDWYSNPEAAKALSALGWKPQSDKERIYFFVGQRNGDELKRHWDLTTTILLKDIESKNYHTIENALYAFIGIGKDEIIPILIEKLNSRGNKTMAEAYLNCGNFKLKDAAIEWAARHGYYIVPTGGRAPVSWGSM